MKSDYVDNWDALPEPVQAALAPIIARFDAGADLLFDRRLNLEFEAAVKELSVPGVAALTQGLRELGSLLEARVTVADARAGTLLFDGQYALTAYDLPLYTSCVYLSQLVQYQDSQNVRVWKETTAEEVIGVLLIMARYLRPDIEHARVCIAALHDMVYLYPQAVALLDSAGKETAAYPNAARVARIAARMVKRQA